MLSPLPKLDEKSEMKSDENTSVDLPDEYLQLDEWLLLPGIL
jgi:hypothetical protein